MWEAVRHVNSHWYHLPTKERHLGMISELQADSIKFDFVVSFDYQEYCFNMSSKRFVENLFKVVSLRLFQSRQKPKSSLSKTLTETNQMLLQEMYSCILKPPFPCESNLNKKTFQ